MTPTLPPWLAAAALLLAACSPPPEAPPIDDPPTPQATVLGDAMRAPMAKAHAVEAALHRAGDNRRQQTDTASL